MHRPGSALAGFIDESIHTSVGLYAIGLVLAAPALSEEARRRLCSVVPAARTPHWSQEDAWIRESRATTCGG
ncbi:hypothetical protein Mro03_48960 [Microbispora rosea subsp. rosea]|nr:hypothetical protein Mro03_48960 [Microbispora rosea subsp. rosea]